MPGSRWLPPLVGAVAFLIQIQYLWPGGPLIHSPDPLPLVRDESIVLYDSYRITQGAVMYRDFFEMQAPACYYLNAALFRVAGPSYGAARLVLLIESAVAAALLFCLVSRWAGTAAGIGAAAIHACAMLPVWPLAYPYWLAEPLGLGGLLVLTSGSASRWRDLAGGILLGLSVASLQTVGGMLLAAVVLALVLPGIARLDPGEALSRPARVLAGAGLGVLPFVILLGVHGALPAAFYQLFVWPPTHYPAGQEQGVSWTSVIVAAAAAHAHVPEPWRSLAILGLHLDGLLPWLAVAGAVVAVPRVLMGLRRHEEDYGFAVVACAGLFAFVPVLFHISRYDLTHVVFIGSFALAGMAAGLGPPLRRRRRTAALLGVLILGAGALAVVNYGAKTARIWNRSRALGSWRDEAMKLPMARTIAARTNPGDRIVVGEMGGFYYLFIRPAAISFTYLPTWMNAYYSDTQWQQIADEVVTRRPRLMLVNEVQAYQLATHRPELPRIYRLEAPFLVLNR